MRIVVALLFVVFVTLSTSHSGEKELDAARKALQGRWAIVSITANGKSVDPQKQEIIVKGNEIRYTLRDVLDLYEIDATKKPMHFDLIEVRDEGKTRAPGIYKLEGDEFHLCLDSEKKVRPTAFESKPGSGMRLIILKRAKS